MHLFRLTPLPDYPVPTRAGTHNRFGPAPVDERRILGR